MQGGLGQFGQSMAGESLMNAPATNPLVSNASMAPQAMGNMMGSPLGNEGANMNPYMQMQQAFMPQEQPNSAKTFAGGGLVSFAGGGMPEAPAMPAGDPMAGAAPQGGLPQPEGAPAPEGGGEEGVDPELKARVEQIFSENMQNPEMISKLLLQLVEEEIQKVVSPEEMEQLHTPEGQQMLQQIVEQIMSQMQSGGEGGALGQMAQGGGAPEGAPPEGAPPGGGLPGMAYGGVVDAWG